jgi:hypothetical protein
MSIFFNKPKPQIGLVGGGATTPEKAMSILDLLNTMDKNYLVERVNGIKIYSYDVIEVVEKFLEDAGCYIASTAIPNIDELHGACFFAYQWPNEIEVRTLSFTYKY